MPFALDNVDSIFAIDEDLDGEARGSRGKKVVVEVWKDSGEGHELGRIVGP